MIDDAGPGRDPARDRHERTWRFRNDGRDARRLRPVGGQQLRPGGRCRARAAPFRRRRCLAVLRLRRPAVTPWDPAGFRRQGHACPPARLREPRAGSHQSTTFVWRSRSCASRSSPIGPGTLKVTCSSSSAATASGTTTGPGIAGAGRRQADAGAALRAGAGRPAGDVHPPAGRRLPRRVLRAAPVGARGDGAAGFRRTPRRSWPSTPSAASRTSAPSSPAPAAPRHTNGTCTKGESSPTSSSPVCAAPAT